MSTSDSPTESTGLDRDERAELMEILVGEAGVAGDTAESVVRRISSTVQEYSTMFNLALAGWPNDDPPPSEAKNDFMGVYRGDRQDSAQLARQARHSQLQQSLSQQKKRRRRSGDPVMSRDSRRGFTRTTEDLEKLWNSMGESAQRIVGMFLFLHSYWQSAPASERDRFEALHRGVPSLSEINARHIEYMEAIVMQRTERASQSSCQSLEEAFYDPEITTQIAGQFISLLRQVARDPLTQTWIENLISDRRSTTQIQVMFLHNILSILRDVAGIEPPHKGLRTTAALVCLSSLRALYRRTRLSRPSGKAAPPNFQKNFHRAIDTLNRG